MNVRNTLERWLTIRQAVAWVQFRTTEAVAAATDADGLAALRIFQTTPPKGVANDLRGLLQEGTIVAQGRTKDGVWDEIKPQIWFDLPVAPRAPERQFPYCQITLDREALLKHFPEEKLKARRGARPKHDWAWIKAEVAKEPLQSQGSLAEVMISHYKEKTGKTIGLSTMKRRLSEWGYR